MRETESVPESFSKVTLYFPLSPLSDALFLSVATSSVISTSTFGEVFSSRLSLYQMASGAGLAVKGTLISKGSPCLTLISRRLKALVSMAGFSVCGSNNYIVRSKGRVIAGNAFRTDARDT